VLLRTAHCCELLAKISTGVIKFTHHGVQFRELCLVAGNGVINAAAYGKILFSQFL